MQRGNGTKLPITEADRTAAMTRAELLRQLSLGTQVAEEETSALARYFVETHQWNKIANGEKDLIRGDKGAGKSAIYSLLVNRQTEFFDAGILIVGAENPRGDTVFKQITTDPPASEQEFITLWKLYILVLIVKELREVGIESASIDIVCKSLEESGLIEKRNPIDRAF
jgi:ABC-type molybdenum transport system ATPase subunit/photorepair protein PhrA